jgi:hypothetical protein
MLTPFLARLIILGVIAVPAAAQVAPSPFGGFGEKPMDPAQIAALVANSKRTMRPASMVLGFRSELALTADQVQQLELLTRGEEDSAVVRQIRLSAAMARLIKARESSDIAPQTGWAGPINEKQLRDEACEQAGLGVEAMLNLMRDRHAVGNILTGTQIDRVQQLEISDMVRALKPKQP